MSEHPNKVQGRTAEELAKQFANTTYEYQAEFFKELDSLYGKEAELEYNLGHFMLEDFLWDARRRVDDLSDLMKEVWTICKDKTTIKGEE